MAKRVKGDRLKDLVCPMCLEIFTNATILICGHTFCKKCLETYDQQHNDVDCIVCPVCRKVTLLGPYRINGLTPNFLVKGLLEDLFREVEDGPSPFCSSHSRVYKDIFCEVCEEFICLTCFFEDHQGHKIQKKEELEEELERKSKYLIQNGRERKTQIEKSIGDAEQQRMEVHRQLSQVEKEVRDVFVRKVTVLQENEDRLLKRVHTFRQHADKQFESFFAYHKELLDNIDRSITTLTYDTKTNLDATTLKAHHLKYNDLERSVEKAINEEPIVRIKSKAELSQFRPADERHLAIGDIDFGVHSSTDDQPKTLGDANKEAGTTKASGKVATILPERKEELSRLCHADEKLLAIGDIDLGATATTDDQQNGGANKEVGTTEAAGQVAKIRTTVRQIALNIVRKVDLPQAMLGMAALSQDAVVVGYGNEREGTDRIPLWGDRKPHLQSELGNVHVYDIAFLTNGRPVLSNNMDSFRVYNTLGTQSTGIKRCNPGAEYPFMCSDQHDKIYVVNGNPEIYIFHGTKSPAPMKVVSTGSMKPEQICVTKTGVMVVGSCRSIPCKLRVFDKKGHMGSFIAARNGKEILCAAVDSEDRVYVARVRDGLSLIRYELEGVSLAEKVTFQRLDLPQRVDDSRCRCYMVSLRPNLIAFATGIHLYFIELPS